MLEAGYLDGAQGPLFYLLHGPRTRPVRAAVLYAHPFAEELNKSRRMAALLARRLAEEGVAVLLVDQFGCGDSAGDFGAARWAGWVADLGRQADWLSLRYAGVPLILWGLRTGCLLLRDLLATRPDLDVKTMLWWQPVGNGSTYLTRFLRLQVAAMMMSGERATTRELKARLDAGEDLEIAGYALSATLARALAESRATPLDRSLMLHWIEVADPGLPPLPATEQAVARWREAGAAVTAERVPGEPFWGTQEIGTAPALVDRSAQRLLGAVA